MTSTADNQQRQIEAVDRLFNLIVRTRFRNTGTSSDPYSDALILWVSTITEVRKTLEPLDVPEHVLGEIEYIYRGAVEAWLRGDEPKCSYADDPATARLLDDEDLEHRLREAVDPPNAWIA